MVRELRAAFPAVNLRLFREPAFCLLCGTAFFNTMGLFGGLFMVPIFLQQVMGFTALQAGLRSCQPCRFRVLAACSPDVSATVFPALRGHRRVTDHDGHLPGLASVTVFTTVAVLLGYNISIASLWTR